MKEETITKINIIIYLDNPALIHIPLSRSQDMESTNTTTQGLTQHYQTMTATANTLDKRRRISRGIFDAGKQCKDTMAGGDGHTRVQAHVSN